MARNIVYIQQNEVVAESFRDTFKERGIDLIVAPNAENAIELVKENDADVLLVDINIPDMRLSKLVEICTRECPSVILDLCVDVMNPLLLTKLVNRHAIHKIFVAPWDVQEMIEEIEESLDSASISKERKMHEAAVVRENEQLEETLRSLTQSLKKQQYSYNKIKDMTDLLFEQVRGRAGGAGIREYDYNFVINCFDKYLKMQTTASIDVGSLEKVMRKDLEAYAGKDGGLEIGTIESCLISDSKKVYIANIRFIIDLLAMYASKTRPQAEFNVESHLNSLTEAVFSVKITGRPTEEPRFLKDFVEKLIRALCNDLEITISTNPISAETEATFDITIETDPDRINEQ